MVSHDDNHRHSHHQECTDTKGKWQQHYFVGFLLLSAVQTHTPSTHHDQMLIRVSMLLGCRASQLCVTYSPSSTHTHTLIHTNQLVHLVVGAMLLKELVNNIKYATRQINQTFKSGPGLPRCLFCCSRSLSWPFDSIALLNSNNSQMTWRVSELILIRAARLASPRKWLSIE